MIRLAVSNIAWPAEQHSEALALLDELGIRGIEVAPTMVWPDWQVTSDQAGAYRKQSASQGFWVSSLQAILFAKPGALLFGYPAELLEHLDFFAALAQDLGAPNLVFGAPKNRLRGNLPPEAAHRIAAGIFRQIAPAFAARGAWLCLEANPPQYGADFLTHAAQAARLVRAVDQPGIGLHLDTACLHLAGEDPAELIAENADILRHFHVSEPFLGTFDAPVVDHAAAAQALRRTGYSGWAVLEMRATATPLDDLRRAVAFLSATYGVRS